MKNKLLFRLDGINPEYRCMGFRIFKSPFMGNIQCITNQLTDVYNMVDILEYND